MTLSKEKQQLLSSEISFEKCNYSKTFLFLKMWSMLNKNRRHKRSHE